MHCTPCLHNENGKCIKKACVYIRISENKLHNVGYHIKGNIWSYNDKNYKVLDFDTFTNEFICILDK